jgi:macrodomain Ter protein organizer (MatP/YcbG family)
LPDRYFDPANKHGFTGTKVWYENQVRSKRKMRLKLILHAQIRRFLNNEKKDTSLQSPRLQLFRQCEARIGKLKDQELLNQFYASILNKSTFNFLQFNSNLQC